MLRGSVCVDCMKATRKNSPIVRWKCDPACTLSCKCLQQLVLYFSVFWLAIFFRDILVMSVKSHPQKLANSQVESVILPVLCPANVFNSWYSISVYFGWLSSFVTSFVMSVTYSGSGYQLWKL